MKEQQSERENNNVNNKIMASTVFSPCKSFVCTTDKKRARDGGKFTILPYHQEEEKKRERHTQYKRLSTFNDNKKKYEVKYRD